MRPVTWMPLVCPLPLPRLGHCAGYPLTTFSKALEHDEDSNSLHLAYKEMCIYLHAGLGNMIAFQIDSASTQGPWLFSGSLSSWGEEGGRKEGPDFREGPVG